MVDLNHVARYNCQVCFGSLYGLTTCMTQICSDATNCTPSAKHYSHPESAIGIQ